MTTALIISPKNDTITRSDQAEAASAHSRINIPLNLENWRHLPEEVQKELLWFHQYALDHKLGMTDCAEALEYDTTTIFRVLKGTYEGSWPNIAKAIQSFRQLEENRGSIQKNEFAPNSISQLIHAGLDYAMANNSITLITGESRQGKTISAKAWRDANNHGRSVYVIAPAYGGAKAFLREIALGVGVGKSLNSGDTHAAILRAFNKHRILIIDEAHRLLPNDRRTNPVNLEIARDIHDRTGAALALIATQRFDTELKKSEYMFEQLIGRIGLPVRLARTFTPDDILPILSQYISRPSKALIAAALAISNAPGRLGILVETLKIASRIANKASQRLAEEHFTKAHNIRIQMMGETQYAKK